MGKADVVSHSDCLEISGEKSAAFEDHLSRLGVFKAPEGRDAFVMYKKVPRTALQQKKQTADSDEDLLTYLFSRWMHVNGNSIRLVKEKKLKNEEFKVWTSVETINQFGSYCQMFVIASEFNRHLFHRELL